MKYIINTLIVVIFMSCTTKNPLKVDIIETAANGHKLTEILPIDIVTENTITIDAGTTYQKITGFGGSFTESSAYLLNQMSDTKRKQILEAYFGDDGAAYSLTRTHMNSCDFSLGHYSYAPVPEDMDLQHFTIEEDRGDIIPMIKEAMEISSEGFKLIASPWTAPPWMKDNNDWVGGKLLPEYYDVWARFFSRYWDEYQKEGIEVWGFTIENEPHGNGNNWESMHYTPEEMTDFVVNHLKPTLVNDGKGDVILLGYDQNRAGIKEWVDVMYATGETSAAYDGTAIHWYESTYDFFPDALQYAHQKAPDKYLIQTEACVDAEVPKWKDDDWYWSKEATDWGWDWAPEDQKYLHPKYVPVFRYARDIIGCLNNRVDGWVDWNMVLNRQGGPNWFENWCVAPVIVDPELDEIYFTPIYYTLVHFSRYIRPGAMVIDAKSSDETLMVTAAQNPDGSIAAVIFNEYPEEKTFNLTFNGRTTTIRISPSAIQTITISNQPDQI